MPLFPPVTTATFEAARQPSAEWLPRFKRGDLGFGRVEVLRGVERILRQQPLQKVDVALKASGSLIQPHGFRAVLYSCDILHS
jgi:hypothetical protein